MRPYRYFADYVSVPGHAEFRRVTRQELLALKKKLDGIRVDEDIDTDMTEEALDIDRGGVDWALEQAKAGETVLIAEDEDGYYFATVM